MKTIIFLSIGLVCIISCGTVKELGGEREVFQILNKITYPNNTITDELELDGKRLKDILTPNDLGFIQDWKPSDPIFTGFEYADCIGCTNKVDGLRPVYKTQKNDLIHFGLRQSRGIENLVFDKKGRFLTSFFTYRNYPKVEMERVLESKSGKGGVISALYPLRLENGLFFLRYIEHSDQMNNGDWYNTASPLKLDYKIDLNERDPVFRFRFGGGFFSYQSADENGEHRMVHFFEPEHGLAEGSATATYAYSLETKGYFGEATFFLIKLEANSEVKVQVDSRLKNKNYAFSILENNYLTLNELMQKDSATYNGAHTTRLPKGEYLIRVMSERGHQDKSIYSVRVRVSNIKNEK